MRMQSDAVRKFFGDLEASSPPLVLQSFKTMALVIRSRIATEERAVFPLYLKNR
jgi:hypothetical protein